MTQSVGVSLKVPENLWREMKGLAKASRLSLGAICLASAYLPEGIRTKAIERCKKARKASRYLSQGRYIYVNAEHFKAAQTTAKKEEVSFATLALALLYVSNAPRKRALKQAAAAHVGAKNLRRALKLRARARALNQEAARLEASA